MIARDAKFSDAISSIDVNYEGTHTRPHHDPTHTTHKNTTTDLAALLELDQLSHVRVHFLEGLQTRMR